MDTNLLYRLLEAGKWSSILVRQFETFVKREMKAWNLNRTEFFFLMGGGLEDKVPNANLFAESLCLDKGTVTKAIKSLECKGLVRRLKTPIKFANNLERHAELTPRGLKAQTDGFKVMQLWSEIVLKDISPEEQHLIMALERRMAKNVLLVTSPTVILTGQMP